MEADGDAIRIQAKTDREFIRNAIKEAAEDINKKMLLCVDIMNTCSDIRLPYTHTELVFE